MRLRASGVGLLDEVRPREGVLAFSELDMSSVKLAYMSREDDGTVGNEDCLARGSGTGGPREGVEACPAEGEREW